MCINDGYAVSGYPFKRKSLHAYYYGDPFPWRKEPTPWNPNETWYVRGLRPFPNLPRWQTQPKEALQPDEAPPAATATATKAIQPAASPAALSSPSSPSTPESAAGVRCRWGREDRPGRCCCRGYGPYGGADLGFASWHRRQRHKRSTKRFFSERRVAHRLVNPDCYGHRMTLRLVVRLRGERCEVVHAEASGEPFNECGGPMDTRLDGRLGEHLRRSGQSQSRRSAARTNRAARSKTERSAPAPARRLLLLRASASPVDIDPAARKRRLDRLLLRIHAHAHVPVAVDG